MIYQHFIRRLLLALLITLCYQTQGCCLEDDMFLCPQKTEESSVHIRYIKLATYVFFNHLLKVTSYMDCLELLKS